VAALAGLGGAGVAHDVVGAMIIRVGIPACFQRFSAVAREIDAPILVSANAFWRRSRFGLPNNSIFNGADVALDSAGFVAMARYWGYRWTLGDYVNLAGRMRPTWWAAPDYCCEPEIAGNRAEVLERIKRTAFKLDWARQVAVDRGVPPPMPVLQGWIPDDYLRCAEMIPDLPALVGVGSVCRRQLTGPTGIIRVLSAIDASLPRHVKLHLFGVKGAAIAALAGHPRVLSVDSQAWDFAARREKEKDGQNFNFAYRAHHMRRWYAVQRAGLGMFA
jgi:hypothetical protein